MYIGWKMGLDPSKYFSTQAYLDKNSDVKEARINPLYHYERVGKYECREFECSTMANR